MDYVFGLRLNDALGFDLFCALGLDLCRALRLHLDGFVLDLGVFGVEFLSQAFCRIPIEQFRSPARAPV